ncbi:MAG: UPF0175 family protein [Acidobacteriota bacterium]
MSGHITDERAATWELDQFNRLAEHRPDLVGAVLRRMMSENDEFRWAMVIEAYIHHKVNLGRAAELLGVPELELRLRFAELGIPVRVGPLDLEEARAEAAALENWLCRAPRA